MIQKAELKKLQKLVSNRPKIITRYLQVPGTPIGLPMNVVHDKIRFTMDPDPPAKPIDLKVYKNIRNLPAPRKASFLVRMINFMLVRS